jgi:hypothetical protein
LASDGSTVGAERLRLQEAEHGLVAWKRWGPYLAERAWGTVREDYSPYGTAWEFFPHDHARSRTYRWNEDGLAGWCDDRQTLCLSLAFWNGRDPILKERIFGLTGNEGNHSEDAKEYWWFVDSTPTHSYMRWRYHYPQREYPYGDLVAESRRRTKLDPEYELLDTGAFDHDRYWWIEAEFAKATPDDVYVKVTVGNAGPEPATIDVLPTLWFRNTWAWGIDPRKPTLGTQAGFVIAEHHELGRYVLELEGDPELLFCDNETNTSRLWGVPGPAFPKDGINDHVIHGAATVNSEHVGTKMAARYHLTVAPGATVEVRFTLGPGASREDETADEILAERRAEADAFYERLTPDGATEDEARVLRQAFAGMLWSKQFFHFDVDRWLVGDPSMPAPPPERLHGRNKDWRHLDSLDVLSMPDTWEYPWFASWDLAFHCVALAHVDGDFAKRQLLLLLREWYQHPNGQLPAYEWAFGDANPPVHAWAAFQVFRIDGQRDYEFLKRVLHKLLINFTWWVNRKDEADNNVFEGGFLGLDNIGPIDRGAPMPPGQYLEQSDGTAWMARYCLDLLEIAVTLAMHDRAYEDVATKFFEHFSYIATAMNDQGLWHERDGFYYDVIRDADGSSLPLACRSMVGLIPITAVTVLEDEVRLLLPDFAFRMTWFERNKPEFAEVVAHTHVSGRAGRRLMSIVGPDRLRRVLTAMLDESEFLSPHGVRSLSRIHREHPLEVMIGGVVARVDYEPAESTSGSFGGNSNWRGPIWFPVNYVLIDCLRRYSRYLGDDFTVEVPTGSGNAMSLDAVADELSDRLISIFLLDEEGRRPCYGDSSRFRTDPAWRDHLMFHEYFHGDTGAGLGASHQTGWTGLVANLILRRAGQRVIS